MKDIIIRSIIIAFAAIALFLFVALPSSAHHPAWYFSADCDAYAYEARYVGGSEKRRLEWDVVIDIMGVQTNEVGDWEDTSNGFVIFSGAGTANQVSALGYIKLYEPVGNSGKWKLVDQIDIDESFSDTCVTPTPTVKITPTASPSATVTPTSTVTPTVLTPTNTPNPTNTPTPGKDPEPTNTPNPESAPTATPTLQPFNPPRENMGWK